MKDSSTAGTAATAMLSLLSTWSRRSPTRARRGAAAPQPTPTPFSSPSPTRGARPYGAHAPRHARTHGVMAWQRGAGANPWRKQGWHWHGALTKGRGTRNLPPQLPCGGAEGGWEWEAAPYTSATTSSRRAPPHQAPIYPLHPRPLRLLPSSSCCLPPSLTVRRRFLRRPAAGILGSLPCGAALPN